MNVLLCLSLPSKASSLSPSLLVDFRPVVFRAYISELESEQVSTDKFIASAVSS